MEKIGRIKKQTARRFPGEDGIHLMTTRDSHLVVFNRAWDDPAAEAGRRPGPGKQQQARRLGLGGARGHGKAAGVGMPDQGIGGEIRHFLKLLLKVAPQAVLRAELLVDGKLSPGDGRASGCPEGVHEISKRARRDHQPEATPVP